MTDIHHILHRYWGYSRFRSLQEDIIRSVLAKKDTLVLMPTGGGKSVCFQVPTLAQSGICIVVSPLIALMRDQVEQLKKRNISAIAIFSGMNYREIDVALDNCVYGDIKFLYLSPERLQTEILQERVKKMKVNLIAVDEAHCISQWGYDFRPSYLNINILRELLPDVPCIALTATATETVKMDIQEKLHFRQKNVFQKSFARANLSYSAFQVENKEQRIIQILKKVGGSVVIYVSTRSKTQEVVKYIRKYQISADFYHAGLTHEQRNRKQKDWIENRIRVIVATNAFGMGIDKPDVRLVIHHDLPPTLEAYYQEAGRAGRDEKRAYAVALFYEKDIHELQDKIHKRYPRLTFVRQVYQQLADYFALAVGSYTMESYDFDLAHFCKKYNCHYLTTFNALKLLHQQGFIQFSESFFSPSKIQIIVDKTTLYNFQIQHEALDAFIKLLLRNYGGAIFTIPINISEFQLARQTKSDFNKVKNVLLFLAKSHIINYQPEKGKPQITFTHERVKPENLQFDQQEIQQYKKRDLEKVHAVIQYVLRTTECRTKSLLRYFGEINYKACGVCDVCLKKNRDKRSKIPYEAKIMTIIRISPKTVSQLFEILKPTELERENYTSALQKLLENKQIQYNEQAQLQILS